MTESSPLGYPPTLADCLNCFSTHEGRLACPSGGSAPVGGRPPAGSADSIFVLKSRRFGKRGGGLCAHRAGPSVADGRARRAGPRPSRADGRARHAIVNECLFVFFLSLQSYVDYGDLWRPSAESHGNEKSQAKGHFALGLGGSRFGFAVDLVL